MSLRTLVFASSLLLAAPALGADGPVLPTLPQLEQQARARMQVTSRIPLDAPVVRPEDAALRLFGPDVPNVVKAMGVVPEGVTPMAEMLRAVLLEGSVATTTRAAMGLRVAQIVGSPYVAAHMVRLLAASPESSAWRAFFQQGTTDGLSPRQRAAVAYAETLTRDVNGVQDEQFAQVRQHFTDNEIVELTIVNAFFNHVTRFVEAVRLPVESWAFERPAQPVPYVVEQKAGPRVGLISDREMSATAAAAAAAQKNGLGLGIANSMRAMFRAPGLAQPWRTMMTALREKEQVGRDVKLQVSLAVSTMNGCRYCIRHQVLGLRRIGVDPARLVALQKDDRALTARERTAVGFARQVTTAPAQVSDADWAALTGEFGDRGAAEVLLQTCTFAFMNRFTDALMLPSEDEAVRVYQETYSERP